MSLYEQPQVVTPTPVMDDLGCVGKGASLAHYVVTESGTEYIAKGPSFTPAHPTVGGNEWVAARLAERLTLPILDHRILSMGGELFSGACTYARGRGSTTRMTGCS